MLVCTGSQLVLANLHSVFFYQQMTPLHVAAKGARIRMVEYLVGKGADINTQDHNKVPRHSNKGAVSIIFVIAIDIKHLSIISLYEMYLGGRFCGSRIGEKGGGGCV